MIQTSAHTRRGTKWIRIEIATRAGSRSITETGFTGGVAGLATGWIRSEITSGTVTRAAAECSSWKTGSAATGSSCTASITVVIAEGAFGMSRVGVVVPIITVASAGYG